MEQEFKELISIVLENIVALVKIGLAFLAFLGLVYLGDNLKSKERD